MTWLIGLLAGTSALGTAGVIGLAIWIIKMSKDSRDDLRELIKVQEELHEQLRAYDELQRASEDLQAVLREKEDELERERAARQIEPPRSSGDPAADIRDAVRRLSKLSEVPGAAPPKDSDDK
jgi:hypothetical protein